MIGHFLSNSFPNTQFYFISLVLAIVSITKNLVSVNSKG